MFEIVEKTYLNPSMTKMVIKAPLVAAKAQAGQFIILRVDEYGERITLLPTTTEKRELLLLYIRKSAKQQCFWTHTEQAKASPTL